MNQLKIQKHYDLSWIDVQDPDNEVRTKLEQGYNLHPMHLNESLQKVQHTQVEREDDYLFLVLHFPVADSTASKVLIGQVGIYLGKDFLITVRISDGPPISQLFEACLQDDDLASRYFKEGAAYLLYILINELLKSTSDMIEHVEGELDNIEGLVFDNSGSDAQVIGALRQKIVRLRRMIGPKRLILEDLTQQIDSFSGQNMRKYYSSNTKMVNKLWEEVEEARENIEIYKDADFTTSTEHTNQILTILTLLFTFTIPVTVFGTLYGMNMPLPGGNGEAWAFMGHYTTFIMVVIASSLLALIMYLYFRIKRWL